MRLLKQVGHNCFAYSAVMVLRHQLEKEQRHYMLGTAHVEGLFGFLEHNGQEVWWPEFKEPLRFRGIHPQEIIDWYYIFGYSLYLYERFPRSAPVGLEIRARLIYDSDKRFWDHINGCEGILIMNTHAVAWDGKIIYDPKGEIRTPGLKEQDQVREAFMICKILEF